MRSGAEEIAQSAPSAVGAIGAYDHCVFDCDGVLLDSNAVKSDAFLEVGRPWGAEAARDLVAYHQAHGGETRQAKLRVFLEEIVGLPPKDAAAEGPALVDRFGTICREKLAGCATIPGVEAYLEAVSAGTPCYVVTGGSQAEVRALFGERGLDRFFVDILGNPTSKRDNMRALAERGAFSGRGCYFGDAALDLELAREHDQDFVFVAGRSEWDGGRDACAGDPRIRIVEDFGELLAEPSRGTAHG